VAAAAAGACGGDSRSISAPDLPAITAASVVANPYNAISALVSVRVRDADSIAVRFTTAALPGSIDSLTPAVPAAADSVIVAVLGLLPDQSYVIRPVAYGHTGTTVGGPLTFTTGALPSDLPRYTASGVDPSPGYVVFAAGRYGIVIDNTGRVVWYRHFAMGPGLSFTAQPNGHYAARPPTPDPNDPGGWVELDPLGIPTRMLPCAGGLRARVHDLIAEPDGGYWLLCDETRAMDLTAVGGVARALVTGTVVQHVSADGALRFSWNPFDHFAIADVDPSERSGSLVNWTHGNAIDLDADGNVIVSFRNLGEVTKIDRRSGQVIWRLGGRRNEFAFIDSPAPSFAGQHSARVVGAGQLMLLDNIGDPAQSRVERFVIDDRTRTARLVHSYGSTPGVSTLIGGSVQGLAGGRTLVSYGTAGRVEEYDAGGRVVWRIDGHAGYVFRAQRIRSLYAPGVDTPR
jgi:hypothetical protein